MQTPSIALVQNPEEAGAQIEQQDGPPVFRTPRIHAVAVNATEMAESNEQIREFLAAKIAALVAEKEEIGQAGAIAAENAWKTDTFDAVEKRLLTQILYYRKLESALEAGFTIVPNMPCDQFAIRVQRRRPAAKPAHQFSDYGSAFARIEDEREQVLPPGDGHYVSPKQRVEETRSVEKLESGKNRNHVMVRAVDFDAIEFPFAAAAPIVMSATHAAMTLKLFDRIGLVPQQVRRDADPIVLGQIVCRQNGRERVTSFLIAWHLDLRTL